MKKSATRKWRKKKEEEKLINYLINNYKQELQQPHHSADPCQLLRLLVEQVVKHFMYARLHGHRVQKSYRERESPSLSLSLRLRSNCQTRLCRYTIQDSVAALHYFSSEML